MSRAYISTIRVAILAASLGSEYERDDRQYDEDYDEPLGDRHAHPGDPAGTEDRRDKREDEEENCKADQIPAELQRYLHDSAVNQLSEAHTPPSVCIRLVKRTLSDVAGRQFESSITDMQTFRRST
ncbi:hypothetical protein GCM10028858_00290 [Halorubrum pallidum]